jgi:hypothetical protein
MDASEIQAEMRAAYDAFRTKLAEFERLVDDRVLLRIRYIQAMNIRSRRIWKRRLDMNGVHKDRAQQAILAAQARFMILCDMVDALAEAGN